MYIFIMLVLLPNDTAFQSFSACPSVPTVSSTLLNSASHCNILISSHFEQFQAALVSYCNQEHHWTLHAIIVSAMLSCIQLHSKIIPETQVAVSWKVTVLTVLDYGKVTSCIDKSTQNSFFFPYIQDQARKSGNDFYSFVLVNPNGFTFPLIHLSYM